MQLVPFIHGFGTGGSLIIAIGAQNAFVLSQSVRRNHHLIIAAICIMADVLLIGLGVSGVGTAVAKNPTLGQIAAYGGAAFLGWYGFSAFRSALRPGSLITEENTRDMTVKAAVLATCAVTFLNPHVYLDTIVLMGSLSGQFTGDSRWLFWIGASCASTLWFLALAFGGRILAPLFRKPSAWRVMDICVGLTMWFVGASLLHGVM